MLNLRKIYEGKKVLVTGHTGFKGAWLCIFMNLLGAKVYGYSLPPKKKSLFNQANCKKFLKKNIFSKKSMNNSVTISKSPEL